MKCVKLNRTSVPTAVKDLSYVRLLPAQSAFEKFAKRAEVRSQWDLDSSSLASHRTNVGDKVATLGSDGMVYCHIDNGLFSAILAAYNNHWKLRTAPDDWWLCVIKRVALAIDAHATKEAVRRNFVEHEGKKTLSVNVATLCIYDVNYELFFQQMSEQIAQNVKEPKFVDTVTADFTTTTPTMKIASQITLMASVQEFFDYGMVTLCGIPAVEMLGTESDWVHLSEKLVALEEILKPISDLIGLSPEWWSHSKIVFKKLLKTFQGSPDKSWWDKIIHYDGTDGSGQTPGYTGWLTEFIEGTSGKVASHNFTSGLVTVPLKIKRPDGFEDAAALVAGMLGYTIYEDSVPIVQPFQGWSLLLPEKSPFRSKTAA